MGVAIAGAALAVSVGAGTYSAVSQNDAAQQAEDARNKAMRGAPKLDPAAMAAQAAQEQARQRQRAAGAYGRQDTILTSPLGLVGGGGSALGAQTLLGR